MKKTLLACLCLALTASAAVDVDSLCEQAAYLLFNRHLAPGHLDSAYRILAGLRQEYPHNEQTLYLWSRIHVQMGDNATDKAEKFALYERARAIADTLVTINDENPDGHMWWGVAHGRIGQTRGVLNSLFMVPKLKQKFNRALELDPYCATAYDALGVLYYELPGLFGGDLDKSERYLLDGIAVDPDYTVLRLDLAKVYLKRRRWDDARVELQELLDTEDPTFPADAELDDKPEARDLLAGIRDR